mgnify:FL=1
MNKLKNKVFVVLITILTSFLLVLVIIFNYQNYQREYTEVNDNLSNIEKEYRQGFFIQDLSNGFGRPFFLDTNVYIVSFDNDFNIIEIISYTKDNTNSGTIKDNAIKFINTGKDKKIGNLYFSKYSYLLDKNNNLIIIDNSNINHRLNSLLRFSVLIFILLEVLAGYISIMLTRWLVKPVEEAFNKQRQFVFDASHELKTPLAVIIASAEMLEKNPKEKKWLSNIKSEADRMNKLVINLLELAKTESLPSKLKYSTVNLSKEIERSILTFEGLVFEKNLEIDYDIEDNIEFSCDLDKIKELLSILLDNAIKHSYDNAKIRVNLFKEKENIILEVINNGDDIPKDKQNKIFERFYRVDEARNRNENRYGLGLAIAKNIVDIHQGKISVTSSNNYTTFKVIFKSS